MTESVVVRVGNTDLVDDLDKESVNVRVREVGAEPEEVMGELGKEIEARARTVMRAGDPVADVREVVAEPVVVQQS